MGQLLVNDSVINTAGVQADGAAKTLVVQAANFGGATVAISISRDGGVTKIPVTKDGTAVTFTANGNDFLDAVKIGLLIFAEVSGGSPTGLFVEIF